MKFYNTLSRKIEGFKPLNDNNVNLYTCGPTVYDFAHLGNLRSFVFDDTLRRALEVNGYNVKHVMNITDVGHLVSDSDAGEDKLERGAARESKSVWEVANFYIDAFMHDTKSLNILPPNGYKNEDGPYARATKFIDQQIEIVKALIDKGFAYRTEQAIYFDVTKLPSYGDLSGQKLDEKEVAAREEVIIDTDKKNPQDFALWFFTVGRFANHTMQWSSPWGKGFPGWHLECSAIIHSTLGDPIDIHTGGVDHIGTHHVNEMAQTEAAYGNKLANIWMHNEFLLVDGKKMAKSDDNFYTLKDIIKKDYNPLALRLLYLQGHYQTQMNFTWNSLEAAQNRLRYLQSMADRRFQPNTSWHFGMSGNDFDDFWKKINDALQNNLNTPDALLELNNLEKFIEQHGVDETAVEQYKELLSNIDRVLGLNLSGSKDIDLDQKTLISEREKAREEKNWEKSDELRAKLLKQGIEIKDTDRGPVWSRK